MPVSLGTSSESIIHEWLFQSSASWVPPYDCRAYVTVIGPGGSGGSYKDATAHESYVASGGGAGGCAKSLLRLDSSVTYTINVGAGGASVDNAVGSAGGANSEFQGSDIDNMAGNLGSGGLKEGNAGTISLKAGGAGGTATGGTIFNCTGGAGGSGEVVTYSNAGIHIASGGGGAAGIFGKSYRGGNAICNTGGADKVAIGGGAGVGGNGGDVTSTGSYGLGGGGGGNAFGDGISHTTVYPNQGNMFDTSSLIRSISCNDWDEAGFSAYEQTSVSGAYNAHHYQRGSPASIFHGLVGAPAGKVAGGNNSAAGPGAGGSGYYYAIDDGYFWGSPGLFGGGAGTTKNYHNSSYAQYNSYGYKGSYGAGGGANAAYQTGSTTSWSGGGGGGLVVITVVEIL